MSTNHVLDALSVLGKVDCELELTLELQIYSLNEHNPYCFSKVFVTRKYLHEEQKKPHIILFNIPVHIH